ncbi:MAG TPA: type II toxin-antitoxin system Phd/YefM family antitoxin [Thermoanaerobaculia bacterium]|nr:type II toxin-antitoxin system Phd/YefM family antitoxin [Thermoanaerobaculia bacterium]
MNAVTPKRAQEDLEAVVDRVVDDADATIRGSDQGKQVVMVPLEEYESWQETQFLLRDPANREHLRRSLEEAKAGQAKEWELIEP